MIMFQFLSIGWERSLCALFFNFDLGERIESLINITYNFELTFTLMCESKF